jgi:MinD-like ATPase involved in chromosome partitioning or flagellar assembly
LILRPDRQDFQGTAVTVDIARRLEVPKMLLLVNKALSSFDFVALKKEVEETYGAPVASIVPLTEEMMQLGSSDIFSLRFPDHPLTQIYNNIAALLLE